jgi:thiol:disulfide interchange protein DsbC
MNTLLILRMKALCATTTFALLMSSATAQTITNTQANAALPPSETANSATLVQPVQSLEDFNLKIKTLYPSTRFDSVARTPVPNLYEVVIGKSIAYIDASGKYFMFGHLYDMQTQTDMTALRMEAITRVDFASLPLGDAIKTVRGNGARKLAVFSDPDCPYCKVLEKNLLGMTDVTIYTFLYPLAGLHPQARAKAIGIWCAKDKRAAWDNVMVKGQPAPQGQCDHPLDRNAALGASMKIQGTPMLISADGRQMPGAVAADALNNWLNQTKVSAASSTSASPTVKTTTVNVPSLPVPASKAGVQ